MNENRVKVQNAAIEAWTNNPRSTLNLCTGLGKTKIAIDIIEIVRTKLASEGNNTPKVLIIVPTETIRDEVFPGEFVKFGRKDLLKFCEISCIQTVYKYVDQVYDLVICDEIHNYLYEDGEEYYEYFKFFENNKFRYILGLSASIDVKRLKSLNRIAPIVFKFSIDQAVAAGIVAPFEILNVKISLTPTELEEFRKVQSKYTYYERLLGGSFSAYENSIKFLGEGYTADQRQAAIIFRALMKKRKTILDNATNKISCARKILEYFSESNGILFSESIDMAERLVENNEKAVVYHSKMKKTEKKKAIDRLNDGRTRIQWVSAVKALNEGLSIDSIMFAIIVAGNSKVKDMIQRIGRSCRFVVGKKAYVFRLFVEGTQEEKWVRSSQREFDQSKIRYVKEEELWKILQNR
jgi:RNA polymerase primary sigma factor